jgi:hypothetical protein
MYRLGLLWCYNLRFFFISPEAQEKKEARCVYTAKKKKKQMSNAYIAESFIEEPGNNSKSYDHWELVHHIDLVVDVEIVGVVVMERILVGVVVHILEVVVGEHILGVVVNILVGVVVEHILGVVVEHILGVVVERTLVGVEHMIVEELVVVQGMVVVQDKVVVQEQDKVEELEQVFERVPVAVVDKVASLVHR